MTRKRIRHEQISNEREKKVVYKKRVESLIKQANDLSILCGVDIGMVIHKPAENNAVLWPSRETFGERMQRFLNFLDRERERKMVIPEKFLKERLKDERDNILKSRKKKNFAESQLLMNEIIIQGKTFDEVDLVQLNGLQFVMDEVLKKLQKRNGELNNE